MGCFLAATPAAQHGSPADTNAATCGRDQRQKLASSNDFRAYLGIGDAKRVDLVAIHWASGLIEKVTLPAVDRIFTVAEGKGIVQELCILCSSGKSTAATPKGNRDLRKP